MSVTVKDIITRAATSIGRLAPGDVLPPEDATGGMVVFSDMLDRWQTERLTIYSQGRNLFSLVSGTQRYTLGPSGTWNAARPLFVDGAARLTADGLETEISLFSRDDWRGIDLKGMRANLPEGVFINPTYPLAAVDVWPVPLDATIQIVLYAPATSLTSVTDLATVLSLAPGWASALRYNLAIALGVEYAIAPSAALVDLAASSKAAIKRTNQSSDQMELDPFLTSRHGSLSRAAFESGDF